MTSKAFEGDFADTCAHVEGGLRGGGCKDSGARTPIGVSGYVSTK
jgi:hypothetical protein